MKVELLKNKHTSIIEKIIINKGRDYFWTNIPFNLTHDQTMIELDDIDLKWHEYFIKFSYKTNMIEIKNELYKDFKIREFNFLFDILQRIHLESFRNSEQTVESWFFNYFMWTVFHSVKMNLVKTKRKEGMRIRVVDPALLLFAEGEYYLNQYNIFVDNIKIKQLLDLVWNLNLNSSKDDFYKRLDELKYSNQDINVLMFQKEIIKELPSKKHDYYLWNLKKQLVSKVLIDTIRETIHYQI